MMRVYIVIGDMCGHCCGNFGSGNFGSGDIGCGNIGKSGEDFEITFALPCPGICFMIGAIAASKNALHCCFPSSMIASLSPA